MSIRYCSKYHHPPPPSLSPTLSPPIPPSPPNAPSPTPCPPQFYPPLLCANPPRATDHPPLSSLPNRASLNPFPNIPLLLTLVPFPLPTPPLPSSPLPPRLFSPLLYKFSPSRSTRLDIAFLTLLSPLLSPPPILSFLPLSISHTSVPPFVTPILPPVPPLPRVSSSL